MVKKIINGKSIDVCSYLRGTICENFSEYYDYIGEKLKEHNDNANCMFYLAELYRYNINRHQPQNNIIDLYQKAANMGHIQAQQQLVHAQYEQAKIYINGDNINEGIEMLIKLYRDDVIKPGRGWKLGTIYEDKVNIAMIKYLIDKQDNLNEIIDQLQNKIVELELRPPEMGGPKYQEAKANFSKLAN